MPRYLAIELTDADARIVRVQQARKAGLQVDLAMTVSFEDIPKDDTAPAERATRLREFFKTHKVMADESVLIVPKQSATIRRVTLPSSDPAELASMAVFEAEKIIPFNVERHIISYSLAGRQDGIEGTDLILAAIDEPVMTQWLGALENTGIEANTADVSSTALARSLFESHGDQLENCCVVAIHVGIANTDISFIDNGHLVTTRSVLLGLRHLTRDLTAALNLDRPLQPRDLAGVNFLEPSLSSVAGITLRPAETQGGASEGDLEFLGPDQGTRSSEAVSAIQKWMERLTTNIQRTAEFSQREYELRDVSRVYLCGDGVQIPALVNALNNQLGVPVERHNPLEKAEIADKAPVDSSRFPALATAWGAAMRLSAGEGDAGLNLLPQSVISDQIEAERRMHYVVSGVVGLVAAVMLFLVLKAGADHRYEMLSRYGDYSEELAPLVENVDDMRSRIDIIRGIRSDNAGALEILGRVTSYEPIQPLLDARIKLTRFEYTIGEEVRLEGHALEIVDINDFVKYLGGLKLDGKNVFLDPVIRAQNQTRLPRRERAIYSFEIVAPFPETGSET